MATPEGYTVETVDVPELLEVGGLGVRENGNVVASTRSGDVWEYDPDADDWAHLARGLHQALGVWIDEDTGDVYTAQKPELTRLVDLDGDGEAELYETLCNEWGASGDYHEFSFGPVRDSEGNFYVTLNLGAEHQYGEPAGPDEDLPGWAMVYGAKYQGWAVKVTPDGEFVPFANGLRSPAGIGINADDELFYTDNEGDWMPACQLCHIEEGNYYGHPASLNEDPEWQGEDLDSVPYKEWEEHRTLPVVWVPYFQANSIGGVTFDEKGNFGPFEGQLFLGDQTQAKVMRVALEEVNGKYQGALFNFATEMQAGGLREAFTPDGSGLWFGQTDRGWGSVGPESYGLQRIDYDGSTVPFEMRSVHVQESGFEIQFTKPADTSAAGDAGNYDVSHWGYDNSASYGSDELDLTEVTDVDVEVLDDGERVALDLPEVYVTPADEEGILGGTRVYEIALNGIGSAEGDDLLNNQAWYTVNNVPE